MIINHNMSALNTHRQLSANNVSTGKSLEKLSSGLRINRAGDDAAGLAISEKMRGQIRGLDQAARNAQDGISLIQTAEGGLNEVHSILQRMRELAVQSANDTNVGADRTALQNEFSQLTSEIGRIKDNTEFNTQKLLDGSATAALKIHVGANASQAIDVDLDTAGVDLTAIHTALSAVNISTNQAAANTAITTVETQLSSVSAGRSYLGALQNRLEHTIANVSNASENLTAAESRIRDVDMAKEMMSFQKNSILSQAAQAMLAQANQQPQGVLQLLR
ncbi:flagellin/flagellar hook associated protein [Desulfitobacterium dichloroeliminans LMG P-21439]|uniref:Flagellin n=1 Tax=Desulfitobacterium dichloroeliminans (strain LMG P-21439 / DCA1) TaxID=871963 RepID=L0FBB0_DESDL|nr:flagellin [Desulfitobacterium dichloroeliminans]AGA70315.1 flagellin/flagellar hook associated protein [Desulfitobacterium dichloroeliminans LMG P-21439]